MRDRDNSGRFENVFLSSEAEMLSSLVYFDGQPFTLVLNQDFKSLTIDPFTGPTGELAVGTHRFSAGGIKAQAGSGDLFRSRTSESGEKIVKITAGKTENLGCGLPSYCNGLFELPIAA